MESALHVLKQTDPSMGKICGIVYSHISRLRTNIYVTYIVYGYMQVSTSNQGLTSSNFDTNRVNVIGDSSSSTMASQISKKNQGQAMSEAL